MRPDGSHLAAGLLPPGADLPEGRTSHRDCGSRRAGQAQYAMIAAVKGWFAVLSALLLILPTDAQAADDLNGAARELARKTVAFAGRGETVAIAWRNLSSFNSSDLSQVRAA